MYNIVLMDRGAQRAQREDRVVIETCFFLPFLTLIKWHLISYVFSLNQDMYNYINGL